MKKTVITLGVIAFIALYSYLISCGFISTAPCDCTPSYDFTIGYILTALFPVLLGLLLYFLFAYKKVFRFKTFLKVVALAFGWLAVAFVLWGFVMNRLWWFFTRKHIIISHISQYGCYADIELTDLVWYLLWLIVSIITGLVICLIAKWKCKKNQK